MHAKVSTIDSPAAMAHVLAMIMATHSELELSELRMLESLDAFRSIGISEAEFLRVADHYRGGPCQSLSRHVWLSLGDAEVIGEILDKVHDTRKRLLLCRLASCIIMADGHVEEIEHQIYERMLLRWGYTRSSVAQAILAERVHRTRERGAERIGAY